MGKLDDELYHKQGNVKGSLWGYNHGIPNGKRKAGEKGDAVQTQSNAEYVPSKSVEELDTGAKINYLTSPKTYEEYVLQNKNKNKNAYKKYIDIGSKAIEKFFNNREKTISKISKVEPIGKKDFDKLFKKISRGN